MIIETSRGGAIHLASFKDGSLALFSALEDAWKRGVRRDDPSPVPGEGAAGLKRRADDRALDARAWSAAPYRASEMAAAPSAAAAARAV